MTVDSYEVQIPDRSGAGRCPWCDRCYQLTRSGYLRSHKAWVMRRHGPVRIGLECFGSGGYPQEPGDG